MTQAQTAASQGYVLGATEGEHLVHFRDAGNIFIKVGLATGSDSLALGTQQVPVGTGIPIHRHFRMDEAFYVLEGSGIFTLNDVRHPFEKGGTIFIPKNAWDQPVAALAVSYVLPILLLPIALYLMRLRA